MKKSLSILITGIMVFTFVFAGFISNSASAAPQGNKVNPKFTVPSFEMPDKDFVQEYAAKTGVKPTGKSITKYSGKAYLKPGNVTSLATVDATGKEHKGIAILVDFKKPADKVSDVPGVNYERIPAKQFDDLLNKDEYNPYSLDLFKDLATYTDVKGNTFTAPTDRTLKNYYKEVSYDKFGIKIDVAGWYELPHEYDYYLGQDKTYKNVNGDAHIGELVSDAIDLAVSNGVDFSSYAVNAKAGDFADLYKDATSFKDDNGNLITQIVPDVFIIHRGTGAEYSEDPSIIWSHKWDILSANYFGKYDQTGIYPTDESLRYKIVDGVVVNTYNICPEVGQDITGYYTKQLNPPQPARRPSPAYVGVYAHEFGHVLGLGDLYDYGYDSEGVGMFSLMASGSYGRNIQNRYYSGNTPVGLDAFSKYFLTFATPNVVELSSTPTHLTLKAASETPDIYKIIVPGSNGKEYFLLENRQQTGYDSGLYEYNLKPEETKYIHGLVVYHVDENVLSRNFHRANEAANWDWNFRGANYKDPGTGENHYGVSVVQADGNFEMEKYINDGSLNDTFGVDSGVTQLSPDVKATPNTTSYYKWGTSSRSYTGITLSNINESTDGIITFDASIN